MRGLRRRRHPRAESTPGRGFWADYLAVVRADAARNPHWEGRFTLGVWRLGQALDGRAGAAAFAARVVVRIVDRVWLRAYMNALLPAQVRCGPSVRLPHSGRGVVIHPTARIGSGATIYHQVTIGVRGKGRAATIGDGVFIGVGAKILGPVTLGDGCRIGANAVVVTDVPAGGTAVGVPATIRPRSPAEHEGLTGSEPRDAGRVTDPGR